MFLLLLPRLIENVEGFSGLMHLGDLLFESRDSDAERKLVRKLTQFWVLTPCRLVLDHCSLPLRRYVRFMDVFNQVRLVLDSCHAIHELSWGTHVVNSYEIFDVVGIAAEAGLRMYLGHREEKRISLTDLGKSSLEGVQLFIVFQRAECRL
ncbi:hypothetical protein Tco_1055549 [Tanacetum coccineum]|uniref:Uncharacterized protein n=1 Tax=Tanacetum coccineum TaxID=301880 RepID=A0ABQ5H1T2_9ASTR